MDDAIARSKKIRESTAGIATWANQDVIWLDQVFKLNQNFPTAEDAILDELTLVSSGPRGGAEMDLRGHVRLANVIARLQESIRTKVGKATPKRSGDDPSVPQYAVSFDATVFPEKGEKP